MDDNILRRAPDYTVALWLEARCVKRGRMSLKDAYQDYRTYCLTQGYQPTGKQLLSAALKPIAPTFRSYGKRTFIPLCIA